MLIDEQSNALSVTQALLLAKGALEQISATIVGEISELSDKAGYKAVYFTLTDATSALSCLMWRNVFDKSGIQLTQGMLIEVTGSFTVYAAKGRMNFTVRSIRPAGEGDLRIKVAQCAKRLEAEGLMDPRRKLPIPALPSTVAVITSPRGKAVHDVLRTLRRRFVLAKVQLFGVTVEGAGSVIAMMEALEAAQSSGADVILLVRGGGSYEDLMPFNDEKLARVIASSQVPIITGIGHEPDTTIADMVASHRASTPTAAAEKAVPNAPEIQARLNACGLGLFTSLQSRIDRLTQRIEALSSRPLFSEETVLTAELLQNLDQTAHRLFQAIPAAFAQNKALVSTYIVRMRRSGETFVAMAPVNTRHLSERLARTGDTITKPFHAQLAMLAAQIESLSPLAVLARGYAVAYGKEGKIIDSIKQIECGDQLKVRVSDGSLDCTVFDKRYEGQGDDD